MKFLLKSSYNTQERPREQDLEEQFCPESSRAHREPTERSVQGLARLVVVLKVIKMVSHL